VKLQLRQILRVNLALAGILLAVLLCSALLTSLYEIQNLGRIKAGLEDPLEAWSEASYIIWKCNSTHYAARNMSTNMVEFGPSTNVTQIKQSAINAMSSKTGLIVDKTTGKDTFEFYENGYLVFSFDSDGVLSFVEENEINDVDWLLKTAYERRVNTTFPYSYLYDELNGAYSDIAAPDLLAGALFYTLDDKPQWLSYATNVVTWLHGQSDKKVILYRYNTTAKTFVNQVTSIDADGYGMQWLAEFHLFGLAEYVKHKPEWKDLLQEAVDSYINQYINLTSNFRFTNVDYDGTIVASNCTLEKQSVAMSFLAYAGDILNNATLKQLALDMALAYPLSSKNLPYRSVTQTGASQNIYPKEDADAGFYITGLTLVYYYTGETNTTVKDRIKTVANSVSTCFWHSGNGRFVYQVNADTGAIYDDMTVHGFGILDEALIRAYLVWGNATWIQRARSDYDDLMIDGHILVNNLVVHGINSDNSVAYEDTKIFWDSFAIRAGSIFYNLNYTGTYLNGTYKTAFTNLYSNVTKYHSYSLGWVQGVNATSLQISTRYNCDRHSAPLLGYVSNTFTSRPEATYAISTLDNLQTLFGMPFVSTSIPTP